MLSIGPITADGDPELLFDTPEITFVGLQVKAFGILYLYQEFAYHTRFGTKFASSQRVPGANSPKYLLVLPYPKK